MVWPATHGASSHPTCFPGPQVSSINLGLGEEGARAPTAPDTQQEDIQKVQESNNNNQSENESSCEEVTPPKNQGLIKARGTYFPLTAFPTSMPQGSVMRSTNTPPTSEQSTIFDEASPPVSMKSKIGVNFMVSVGRNPDTGDNALAKLLQASQEMVSCPLSSPLPSLLPGHCPHYVRLSDRCAYQTYIQMNVNP